MNMPFTIGDDVLWHDDKYKIVCINEKQGTLTLEDDIGSVVEVFSEECYLTID